MRTRQISPYFDVLEEEDRNHRRMCVYLKGIALLRLPLLNKGTAFSFEERQTLKLDGLLPSSVHTMEEQLERVYAGFKLRRSPIRKHQYLRALQERNEFLFYALLSAHLEEMMPIVYTPTVGQAVQEFDALYQHPRGLSLSPLNIDRALEVADSYPMDDVRMIVATDSSAILGIGDQGYGGLAIPIGKLSLYTVGGGVCPLHTLPVSLDVGTSRWDLIEDPRYLGVRQERLTGEEYLAFVDKFVAMVEQRWPAAVLQWEDLSKDVAFEVLERYRDRLPSFNDDIQGTGAVALSGLLSACRLKGERLVDQRVVIHGAGAGGAGVAWVIRKGMEAEGLTEDEARRRVLVLDSRGLLLEGRAGVSGYKARFAQPRDAVEGWVFKGAAPNLCETIRQLEATALLGLSGQSGAFREEVVRTMASNTERPVVFPLSNPTSSSEAAPADIYAWSDGKAIVATGSPFAPVDFEGAAHPIGQGNNAFIFPGLGLGVILSYAKKITDELVLTASNALTEYTAERYLDQGLIYPPIEDLSETSVRVATAVVRRALADGLGELPERWLAQGAQHDLEGYVRKHIWKPRYLPFVAGESRPF